MARFSLVRNFRPQSAVPLAAAALVLLAAGCAWVGPEPVAAPSSPGLIRIAAAEGRISSDAAPTTGSAYGSYLAGIFADRQHDMSVATDFMLQALDYDPDNVQLLARTFMLAAGSGRHEVAVELARRLQRLDPDNSVAALVLSVDAFRRGDLETADSTLAALPDRGLNTLTSPLLRGWMQLAAGNLDAAIAHGEPLQNKKGFGVLYHLHIGMMNDVAGRSAAALEAYEAALESAGQPTLRLTWVVGNFLERAGLAERAEALYSDFLTKNPSSSLMGPVRERVAAGAKPAPVVANAAEGMAEVLFNLASLLSQERAEEVAMVHGHLSLRLKPDLEIARILLGEILESQGRGLEAIANYRAVPGNSPYAWMVRLRIAEELEKLGMTQEAVTELEDVANLRPERFEPLFRLGNLMRISERYEEAVEAYDRAAERIAEPERRHWTLFYFRGIALERLSEWSRAEKDFLQALQLEPEQPFVMNYLAYSWVEQKLNLDEAKKMLVRAVELRPQDGYIVDSLGWVYYRLGEYDRGVEYLERAVELRPQDPVINDHLGDAYWQVGRRQEARFQWRRALSLGPEETIAPTIKAKIERGLAEQPKDI